MKEPKSREAARTALKVNRIIHAVGYIIPSVLVFLIIGGILFLWQKSIITGLTAVKLTPVPGVLLMIWIIVWSKKFERKEAFLYDYLHNHKDEQE